MRGVNKAIIVGHLGNDPEVHRFDNGGMITNISVATSEKWTDKNTGELREQTEWHRITFFGRLAEVASQYLRKGSPVYIEGKIKTRKWTDQQGIDRYTTEIHANSLQMLGSKNQNNNSYNQSSANGYSNYNSGSQGNQAPNTGQGFSQTQAPHGQPNNNVGYNTGQQPPQQGGQVQQPHQKNQMPMQGQTPQGQSPQQTPQGFNNQMSESTPKKDISDDDLPF